MLQQIGSHIQSRDRGFYSEGIMKKILIILAVLFLSFRCMAAHLDDVVITITIPDDYSDEVEEIIATMPALLSEPDEEGISVVIEETTEEKVKRFSSELVERYWLQKIFKLRRYKASLTVDKPTDLIVE